MQLTQPNGKGPFIVVTLVQQFCYYHCHMFLNFFNAEKDLNIHVPSTH